MGSVVEASGGLNNDSALGVAGAENMGSLVDAGGSPNSDSAVGVVGAKNMGSVLEATGDGVLRRKGLVAS